MHHKLIPAVVGLALLAGACGASSDDESSGNDVSESESVDSSCENNLDVVNAATVDEVELENDAFGAELVISEGGPKSDETSPEDDTVHVVISGTDIPEADYRAEWPAESPGADEGKNFFSFTLANPEGPVGPDQSYGTEADDVAEVTDVVFYNGSTELTPGAISVQITEMTNDTLCGMIQTIGTDGVGVAGPFKAERN